MFRARRTRCAGLRKALEDAFDLFVWHARPVVRDHEDGELIYSLGPYQHVRACRRVCDDVLQQRHADAAGAELLDQARTDVETIEARLSRFRDNSALSRLNRERAVDDALLAEVVQAAEEIRALTGGAYDARIGAAIAAVGYDRSFEAIGAPARHESDCRRPDVRVERTRVMLAGDGSVDLGGIAKGWTIDRLADLLAAAGPCMVDGGGDIAVRGHPADADEWLIGVGDGLAVGLRNAAVATSSSLRRRWRYTDGAVAHHIIDPGDGLPTDGVQTAVVVAATATLADALATAVVVDPHRALPAVAAVSAEALLQHADGRWEMTPGMEQYLR